MTIIAPQQKATPAFSDRLTLKAVKVNHAMSEETLAYTASLYLDGKKVGTAMNRGHGGPDEYRFDDPAIGEQVLAIGASYDPSPYGGLEVLIGDMLADRELQREAAKTHRKGYRFAVLADDRVVYGFNDPANILPTMERDDVKQYRVFEKGEG